MDVELDVHNYLELGNKGLTLRITDTNGQERGRLTVGRGGVAWYKKHAKKPTSRMKWEKFLAVLNDE